MRMPHCLGTPHCLKSLTHIPQQFGETDRPSPTQNYIDDGIIDTKLSYMETVNGLVTASVVMKLGQAWSSCLSERIQMDYSECGINWQVNEQKTNPICISDAMTSKVTAHIYTISGSRFPTTDSLKLLRFSFETRPVCHEHVEAIRCSFCGRFWLIIHMKQNGYTEEKMLKAYTTIIQPIVKYVAPAFHSQLNDKQD